MPRSNVSWGDIARWDLAGALSTPLDRVGTILPSDRFSFGLDELPEQPGLVIVRGPRQYGKSTWIEQQIERTYRRFGPGSAFCLNGDDLVSQERLGDSTECSFDTFAFASKHSANQQHTSAQWPAAGSCNRYTRIARNLPLARFAP